MYCSKCGKHIDYESNLCLECTAMLAIKAKQAREEAKADGASPDAPVVNPVSVNNNDNVVNNEEVNYSAPSQDSVSTEGEEGTPENNGYTGAGEESRAQNFMNYVNSQQTDNRRSRSRTEGLKMAIIGVVIPEICYAIYNATHGSLGIDLKPGFVSYALIIGGIIASVLLGVLSILTFRDVKRAGYPTPVATLILGIASIASSMGVALYLVLEILIAKFGDFLNIGGGNYF